jgi:hypothetical protein
MVSISAPHLIIPSKKDIVGIKIKSWLAVVTRKAYNVRLAKSQVTVNDYALR